MAATRTEINHWLDRLYAEGSPYTHMIVVCDTYDFDDYPVYVEEGEDVREEEKEQRGRPMSRIMEVYSRNHTREEQMAEHRAFHYD